jgi:peptide chain release factor 3
MLIDAANGVETQTKKLFEVCALRQTPVLAFVNKMDREGRDPFELMDEIEKTLGIRCYPVTWPIGMGPTFRGVYHRLTNQLLIFEKNADRARPVALTGLSLDDPAAAKALAAELGDEMAQALLGDIELLKGAGDEFDRDEYLAGRLAPLFFGSAVNNFGVQTLLEALIEISPAPLGRDAKERHIDAHEDKFSAFIFKIQANMDPQHRDRVAFMRICSGRFERNMKAHHVRLDRDLRLGRPTQFMAQDRSLVDEAYAGDIVGIHDPGVFKIGDSPCSRRSTSAASCWPTRSRASSCRKPSTNCQKKARSRFSVRSIPTSSSSASSARCSSRSCSIGSRRSTVCR